MKTLTAMSLLLLCVGCSASSPKTADPVMDYLTGKSNDSVRFLEALPTTSDAMSALVDSLNHAGKLVAKSSLDAVPFALGELAKGGNDEAAKKLFWYATLDGAMGEGGIEYLQGFAKVQPCKFLAAFRDNRALADKALSVEALSPAEFELALNAKCGLKDEAVLKASLKKLVAPQHFH